MQYLISIVLDFSVELCGEAHHQSITPIAPTVQQRAGGGRGTLALIHQQVLMSAVGGGPNVLVYTYNVKTKSDAQNETKGGKQDTPHPPLLMLTLYQFIVEAQSYRFMIT